MKFQSCVPAPSRVVCTSSALSIALKKLQKPFTFLFLFLLPFCAMAQAVTSIITDYKGYWKTSSSLHNDLKPTYNHNLLAFTFNQVLYSTGVNDELLYKKGESFSAANFWCLPVNKITGKVDGNTKIGVGALLDGVLNGAGNTPPENDMIRYLTDGIKGLNIGSCVANLPIGELYFSVHSINATEIGDGKPDILVTQVADPSGDYYDRYEFTDANGNRVGHFKDIVFTSINPVGNWVGDFYEASQRPMTLLAPYIQTSRPIRLWAADLSEFGLNGSNINQIRNFKINLSGRSDVAFVAYNKNGMSIGVLPVNFTDFKGVATKEGIKLNWQTENERDLKHFVIERSQDGMQFNAIGTVTGNANNILQQSYHFTDRQPLGDVQYYRLKQVDNNGTFTYSPIVQVKSGDQTSLQAYPNPGKGIFTLLHPKADQTQRVEIYNSYGALVGYKTVGAQTAQTYLDLQYLPKGAYYLLWKQSHLVKSLALTIQ